MHPYRKPTTASRGDSSACVADDHALGVLLLLIGGVRVVLALVAHEVFGQEQTVALVMVALAIGLLLRRS